REVEGARAVAGGGRDDEGVVERVDRDELGAVRRRIEGGEPLEARGAGPHLTEHGVRAEPGERPRALVGSAERDDAVDAGRAGAQRGTRDEPAHAVRDHVHLLRARLAPDALDDAEEPRTAALDVAPQGS